MYNGATWLACSQKKYEFFLAMNFISSKDTDKKYVMHSKKDNIEIIIDKDTADAIKKITFSKYQIGLEKSMQARNLYFYKIDILY